MPEFVVSYPHLGNYATAFRPIADMLECETRVAPPITKRTVELGCKYSPEAVCIPFKYTLGSFIEAIEDGANVLVQAGGGCRFGFYGEVQEAILRDLGYDFFFVKLNNLYKPKLLLEEFRKVNPHARFFPVLKQFVLAYFKAHAVENMEDIVRARIGFERRQGAFEGQMKAFLKDLDRAHTRRAVRDVEARHREKMLAIPVDRPENPLRVGVVGEVYILMEPFSNFDLEAKLGKMGIDVKRHVTITGIVRDFLHGMRHLEGIMRDAQPYLAYHIGAHGTESVAIAQRFIRQGYDGIIHVKPFGCMPEVSAMSALHRMSQDYGVPIIHFSFDSQTSETGINTRLEAFRDMLEMRRGRQVRQ